MLAITRPSQSCARRVTITSFIATSHCACSSRLTSRKVQMKKLSNLFRMTQSTRVQAKIESLVRNSTHISHSGMETCQVPWFSIKNGFQFCNNPPPPRPIPHPPRERHFLKGVSQDLLNKMNFHLFSDLKHHTHTQNRPRWPYRRGCHPVQELKRPHWPPQRFRLKGLLRRLRGCQRSAERSVQIIREHTVRAWPETRGLLPSPYFLKTCTVFTLDKQQPVYRNISILPKSQRASTTH